MPVCLLFLRLWGHPMKTEACKEAMLLQLPPAADPTLFPSENMEVTPYDAF